MKWFKNVPSDERHESQPISGQEQIHASHTREDEPRREIVYTASLPRGCTLKVTCKTLYTVWRSGAITQANGKWVLFDPESPADKILDRELLPHVERLCEEILRLDQIVRNSKPTELTDKNGRIWRISDGD